MSTQLYNFYANDKLAFFADHVKIFNNKCGKITKIEMPGYKGRILQEDNILIKKIRQVGISELIAAEIAYNLNFKNDYYMLCMCPTKAMSIEMRDKVIRHFSNIPDNIRIGVKASYKSSYETVNNNEIVFSGESKTIGISRSLNALYMEEVDGMKDFHSAYLSAIPCLLNNVDTKILITTTPSNANSYFNTLWNINNKFDRIEITYNSHSTIPKKNTLNDINEELYEKIINDIVIL